MKRIYLLQPLVCLCLSLPFCTGCDGEESELPIAITYPADALRILSVDTEEGDVGSSNSSSNNSCNNYSSSNSNNLPTRSITTDVQTDGGTLGIYAIHSDDLSEYTPTNGINPATYTYSSSNNRWGIVDPAQQLRLPTSGSLGVYAWHPVDKGLTPVYGENGNSYLSGITVLAQDDFAATGQADYLYPAATVTVSAGSPTASFTLKHALAKLTFKVYKASSLSDDDTFLTGIQIRDYSTTLQTGIGKSMLLKDGTLQGLSSVRTITLQATDAQKAKILQKDEETVGVTTTASPFCLLAPAASVEYLSFYLTTQATLTGDQERTFLTQQVDFSSHRWTAGKHLIITIMLNGMGAVVTGMQVYSWSDYSDTHFPIS